MYHLGGGMIAGILVVIVLLIGGWYIGSQLLRTAPSYSSTPTPAAANPADIDRSGTADESDRILVRSQLGCIKTQPCWNKTVGKTKDGDNPLYTFDLDLNHDNAITQKDVDLIK